jgi:hypothetical protein
MFQIERELRDQNKPVIKLSVNNYEPYFNLTDNFHFYEVLRIIAVSTDNFRVLKDYSGKIL